MPTPRKELPPALGLDVLILFLTALAISLVVGVVLGAVHSNRGIHQKFCTSPKNPKLYEAGAWLIRPSRPHAGSASPHLLGAAPRT